ncbi:tRNA(Met) cytidine acetyltransferase TmcA [Brenneria izbisi]|uniref:tRNA(Met) cytidine acetyltransferase TmcA n=1 Tax=Brenneria izbisi TaxID=2939450 RepID=A0AA41XU08_9GAMM|nr:GNAT family N-acetyltransferase [Brenneria izbisi]MCV9877885.1 GNAT family N-acetyltransferase [Brenneria izbisi]MCV9881551.1 GNAT family N-acetyltransferase [Brenneria izbisi]
MFRDFLSSQSQQRRYGVRRLLVLSGEQEWSVAQALSLTALAGGDWLWLSERAPAGVNSLAAGKVRTRLGHELGHVVFDARNGLDVEALAMLSGTLQAGSWLLLLVPPWQTWRHLPDEDSLRWSEQAQPIAAPRFIQHFQRHLLADDEVVIWRQGQALTIKPLTRRPDWRPVSGEPTAGQQHILARLLAARRGVYVITAPRGRGKSTLAGMLTQRCAGPCWITAPSRSATAVLQHYARSDVRFWAPDALLEYCRLNPPPQIDWLLIDEAAAIPSPLLNALLSYFPRILMTTTVQGYEGTGRGFLLKFCAGLPQWQAFTLDEPLRWAHHDPLERVLDNALLFAEPLPHAQNQTNGATGESISSWDITEEQPDDWLRQPSRMRQCYALLCSAHYRTSPLDLRRLLDAPGMHVYSARASGEVSGVLWMVDEGGLCAELAHAVWAGVRRPRGNLVAQSLAAHGGLWYAPMLRAQRISRIAITAPYRRQGIGRALIEEQKRVAQTQGLDYLSVSFGYQPDLSAFWQSCGFQLVRIGSHLEASSGCYNAMALFPLSHAGRLCVEQGGGQLARDWGWLRRIIPLDLSLPLDESTGLDEQDWRTLAGFAFASRPMASCYAALCRLVYCSRLALPTLRLLIEKSLDEASSTTLSGLSGKKALLRQWREETAAALHDADIASYTYWRDWALLGPAAG